MIKKRLSSFLFAAIACSISVKSFGAGSTAATSGLCSKYIKRLEVKHNMPRHMLKAVAVTESGRYMKSLDRDVPWPWTLNVKGKGYYFDTKEAALTALKKTSSTWCKKCRRWVYAN